MKVCSADRNVFYRVLRAAFNQRRCKPRVLELGVLRGENAAEMDRVLAPESLWLVDAWSSGPYVDDERANAGREWVASMNEHVAYFGGSVLEQSTFDRLYEQTRARFAGSPHVRILRSDSRTAAETLHAEGLQPRGFDLIYVDANHQYEAVLDDLMRLAPFVCADGVLQMNDCCHSEAGARQNLGVLEAVTSFLKRSDFVPVALTNTDFSDLLMVRRSSPMARTLHGVFERSRISYVEVPDALLGAARVRGPSGKISFV